MQVIYMLISKFYLLPLRIPAKVFLTQWRKERFPVSPLLVSGKEVRFQNIIERLVTLLVPIQSLTITDLGYETV